MQLCIYYNSELIDLVLCSYHVPPVFLRLCVCVSIVFPLHHEFFNIWQHLVFSLAHAAFLLVALPTNVSDIGYEACYLGKEQITELEEIEAVEGPSTHHPMLKSYLES